MAGLLRTSARQRQQHDSKEYRPYRHCAQECNSWTKWLYVCIGVHTRVSCRTGKALQGARDQTACCIMLPTARTQRPGPPQNTSEHELVDCNPTCVRRAALLATAAALFPPSV